MPRRTLASLRTALALTLVFALSAPVMPAAAATDEGGTDIASATALPASPATGSLDVATDAHDVFSVSIPAGQRLVLSLTGDAGSDFDMNLFAPDATTIFAPAEPIVYASTGEYPETLTYDSTSTATYFLDLEAWGGTGAYTLTWEIVTTPPADADDSLPGVALPASPVAGTLSDASDTDDVYSVDLTAGQTLNVQLTGDTDTEFFLYLLGPDAVSLESAPLAFSADAAYPEKISYTATVDGTYYLDAYANFGSGAYEMGWEIVADGGSGGGADGNGNIASATPTTAPSVEGSVDSQTDPHDVFAMYALPGQTLNLSLTGPVDSDLDLRLFGPDATDIADATPIQETDQGIGGYPETISYVVSEPGTYYADVFAFEGGGEYALNISKVRAASKLTLAVPAKTVYATPATLTGTLKRSADSAGLGGRKVYIDVYPLGATRWQQYATTYTDETGAFAASLTPMKRGLVRARFSGDVDHIGCASTAVQVTPFAYLTAPSAPAAATRGVAFTSVGVLKPAYANGAKTVKITAYRKESGVWVPRRYFAATNRSYSTYTQYRASVTLPSAGSWKLVASVGGYSRHQATVSAPTFLTVK